MGVAIILLTIGLLFMNPKIKETIFNLIESFFISFAFMNAGNFESSSILVICIFAGAFILLQNKSSIVGEISRSVKVAAGLLGAMFSVLYSLFGDLTGGLENKLFIAVFVICSIIGLFFMFSELLIVIITKSKKKSLTSENNPFSFKIMLIYAAVVFVCCLPFFALNFPGIMTPDSLSQYCQIMGIEPWVNHHPWFHTLIMGIIIKPVFAITGNEYIAIACYTIFQMILVAFSIGYCIECMYEFGFSRGYRIALLLCFILLPYNLIYAVTLWKDIIFSMAVLILTVTTLRIWNEFGRRDMIIFMITGILMCLVRHNGFYAFVAFTIILLILKRKEMKRYAICCGIVIIVAFLCRGPIPNALGIEKDEFLYNLPVVLQQVGRVIVDDCEMDIEDTNFLENINSLDFIRAGYSKQGADPMSAWILCGNSGYFNEHKSDFLKLWIKYGLKYPGEYIKAYLDITMGYWAPMQPQQTVFFGITEYGIGLESKPVIGGPVLIKINELLYKFYTMIPVYGFMYCMGGFFWILLILGTTCIIRGDGPVKSPKLISMIPVFMLTGTLFVATPLVADLRYNYALMLVIPYLILCVLRNEKANE